MNNKSFRFLWIGQSLANSGDVFYIVGLLTLIYSWTSSAIYMSIVPFTITLASFCSSLLAPLIIDRFSLKQILSYSQLIKVLLLGCLLLLLPMQSLVVTFVLIMLISFLDGMAYPASSALVPHYVGHDTLPKANSLLSTTYQTIQLGGWASGGIIVSLIGSKHTMWLTCVLYIIAAVMMFVMDNEQKEEKQETEEQLSTKQSLIEGWQFIRKNKLIKLLVTVRCFQSMAAVVWIAAILYIYVEQVLQVSESWWGYINASFMVGLLLGGIYMFKTSDTFTCFAKQYVLYGLLIASIITIGFGFTSFPFLALLLVFIHGIIEEIIGTTVYTMTQQATPLDVLPKVSAAENAVMLVTFSISSLFVGVLAHYFGVTVVFTISGLILFGAFLLVWWQRETLQ
ncbi:MFS transporter [Priestia taiwanensis]|uniref:MFS-type transporter YfmI n=1 Tax=Priestia taiwanensis TaxID=1347902 RepID=A0A917AJ32_9BACI|nr:MFS transporter [Priestia taiwanensis]MBM7361775.1 MFS family permease [Priestia taiwanensis]GGE56908.1 putative MFS-type transporter YfmI [Priestia taiwanensis]